MPTEDSPRVATARNSTLQLTASLLVGGMLLTGIVAPADARVRFGNGVFIGGHDFSNQTYGPRRRAVIRLSRRAPPHPGCAWHPDRHGGKIKVCHLQTVPRSRR